MHRRRIVDLAIVDSGSGRNRLQPSAHDIQRIILGGKQHHAAALPSRKVSETTCAGGDSPLSGTTAQVTDLKDPAEAGLLLVDMALHVVADNRSIEECARDFAVGIERLCEELPLPIAPLIWPALVGFRATQDTLNVKSGPQPLDAPSERPVVT